MRSPSRPRRASRAATSAADDGDRRPSPKPALAERRSCARGAPSALLLLVDDKAAHLAPREAVAPAEERELDHERAGDHLRAGALDELAHRRGGAAGSEQVVVDEYPRPAGERVRVYVEGVDAVLELVLDRRRLGGKLAGLPRRDEAGAG